MKPVGPGTVTENVIPAATEKEAFDRCRWTDSYGPALSRRGPRRTGAARPLAHLRDGYRGAPRDRRRHVRLRKSRGKAEAYEEQQRQW